MLSIRSQRLFSMSTFLLATSSSSVAKVCMQSACAPVLLPVSLMVLCRILMLSPKKRIPSPSPPLGALIVVFRTVTLLPWISIPGASGPSIV